MPVRIGGVCILLASLVLFGGRADALGLSDVMSTGKDMAKKMMDKQDAEDAQKKKDEEAKRKKAEQEQAQRQKEEDARKRQSESSAAQPAPPSQPAAASSAKSAPAPAPAAAAKPASTPSAPAVAAGPSVPGGFAYLLGGGDGKGHEGSLWVYSINKGNGMLEEVPGATLYTKGPMRRLHMVPGSKFFYGFQKFKPLTGFVINSANGIPSEMAGSPFKLGEGLEAVALDPGGTVLYAAIGQSESEVGNKAGHFAAFAINPDNGSLKEIDGSRTKVSHVESLAIAPSGAIAYMIDGVSNEPMVHTYAIDPKTRAFKEAPKTQVSGGVVPTMIKVRPDGRFLYVMDSRAAVEGEANILVYRIDAASGALSPVAGSPFEVGHGACYLTTDANGKFVFVANCGSSTAAVFTADAETGALKQVGGSPFRGGTGPVSLAVEPSGNYLYVPNDSSRDMSIWSINPGSGVLTSLSKYPFKWDRAFHEIAVR